MIVEIPDDNSIVKWKNNEVDTWGCNDYDKYDFIEAIDEAPTVDIPKPNCVICDHFGKCEGCKKREEE